MRGTIFVVLCLLVRPLSTFADVTGVTITSRAVVAGGHAFGTSGPYEKLIGRIEFALDPKDPHNRHIADLEYAPRAADGRVHFSSDLYVLRPVDPARGNGVLFFEVPNRGGKGLPTRFSQDAARSDDPSTLAEFGDALLMRDGYTLVLIGWEFGLSAPNLGLTAPPATRPPGSRVDPIGVDVMVRRTDERDVSRR